MTEKEIVKIISFWLDDRKYPFQLSTVFIYAWECDYWAMTSGGETREFEIKISRADYFNDSKKQKHKSEAGANFFYYVVPEGLIIPDEVDKKYGLIYVNEVGGLKIIRKSKRLNYNTFSLWKELANKMYWRYRALWREKYKAKEITRDEYVTGFNLDLELDEPLKQETII